MSTWIKRGQPLTVGDTVTVKLDGYYDLGDTRGTIATCSSVMVHGYDPDRPIDGAADTAGATTLTDTSVLNAFSDNQLIGLPVEITDSDGTVYHSEVTDNDQSDSQITFNALEITPAAGDTFRIIGYPLLTQTTGTASTNRVSHQITSSNMTGTPGNRVLVFRVTREDTDIDEAIGEFEVRESRPPDRPRGR